MSLKEVLAAFVHNRPETPATAVAVEITENEYGLPLHTHASGQLLLALRGNVVCMMPESLWMVPPQCAVWIPAGTAHCSRVSAGSSVCLLFVREEEGQLPPRSCTLSITPLVRELIRHVAALPQDYEPGSHTERLVQVLLTELSRMPVSNLRLPASADPRLRTVAESVLDSPAQRRTLADWAKLLGMSRRSLARLVTVETGMSFGQWSRQLYLLLAIHRLSEGASVQETAWALGYESVTAFITMFKKALGTSPAQYALGLTRQAPD